MTVPNPSSSSDRAFLDWLTSQRWYGDKAQTIESFQRQPITRVEIDGTSARISAGTIRFEVGGDSTYLLTLDESAPLAEATALPGFLRWLAAGFATSQVLPASDLAGATLHWEPMAGTSQDWVALPPRLLSGEQSNSSIIYGDAAIVKLFRKLQAGINPDSEIVAFLTGQTEYRHVPSYLGGIVLRFDDGREAVELAAVQGFVANQGACWRWLPPALVAVSDDDLAVLLDQVGLLGQRTGELHTALASATDLPAFDPEFHDATEAQAVAARIRREVADTCAALRARNAISDDEATGLETALGDRIGDASVLEGLPRIRVHGDYHLGQVLRAGDDFVIIDFEGEPSRSMDERRQKHSPFKDVAGMLRSLDYAVSSAGFESGEEDGPRLQAWGRDAEARFVERYREAVVAAPIPLVPAEAARFDLALDLYMVEKAVYEVRYELGNRPDWLEIPLGGLRRIANRAQAG